jgi:hypothetical protein
MFYFLSTPFIVLVIITMLLIIANGYCHGRLTSKVDSLLGLAILLELCYGLYQYTLVENLYLAGMVIVIGSLFRFGIQKVMR